MRGVMNKERGTKAILTLCVLLAVALLLWQGTTTTRAQEPTPPSRPQEPPPVGTELSAAHLSPDGCSELIINGSFEVTNLHWGLAGTDGAAELFDVEGVCG